MPPRIALITPRYSYRIAAYLQAAAQLDVELVIVSNGEHSLIGAVRRGINVDFDDPAAVASLKQGRELGRGFMINYHMYRHYFPMMAMGRARKYLARHG